MKKEIPIWKAPKWVLEFLIWWDCVAYDCDSTPVWKWGRSHTICRLKEPLPKTLNDYL